MQLTIENLGRRDNIDVLSELVDLNHRTVVDVGCGSLTFSNILAEQGARVLAIDPDPIQAELNRKNETHDDITFVESSAEKIPTEDQSMDAVFFSYSLHHIPIDLHDAVFSECQRVLKPGGFVYIIEPIDCPFNRVMKLFHNEEVERQAAWNTLEHWAEEFESVKCVEYHGSNTYSDWQQFANRLGTRSYNPDYTYEDVNCPSVKEAFEKHATKTEEGYEFLSPKRAVFMNGLKRGSAS